MLQGLKDRIVSVEGLIQTGADYKILRDYFDDIYEYIENLEMILKPCEEKNDP